MNGFGNCKIDLKMHIKLSGQIQSKLWFAKNLNWGQFKENDEVFVYFPTTKSDQSPKFTSYWHGPYKITKKYQMLRTK